MRTQAFQADCKAFSAFFLMKNPFAVLPLLALLAGGFFSPLSFSDTTALRSAEISLAQRSFHLQKCREACLTNCRSANTATCSKEMCDMGACRTAKQAYDVSKQVHTTAVRNLERAQRQGLINQNKALAGKNQAIKGGAKSALKHTKEARENMGLYVVMGVGTTALLTYMAYTCCSSAFGGGGGATDTGGAATDTGGAATDTGGAALPGVYLDKGYDKTTLKRFYAWLTGPGLEICSAPFGWAVPSAEATSLPCSQVWCPVYAGGAVVAGLQTLKMYRQREKLKKIEESLCEKDAQTGVCSDSDSGTQLAQTKWAEVPGCGDDSDRCQQTMCAIDPASPSCGPSSIKTASANKGDISSLESGLPQRLSMVYQPQGGWPQNQNPYLSKSNPAIYDPPKGDSGSSVTYYNLSPSEKRALDNALRAHNQQQQAYLSGMGADAPEGIKISSLFGQKISPEQAEIAGSGPTETETYFESEPAVAGQARAPSGSNMESGVLSGSPPPGPWTAGAPGAVPSTLSATAAPQKGKAGSLKREMDHILNKYYQDGRGQNDPYQGKFTEVGSSKTPVGLKDDNLFLMSHRLHRRMSSDQAFLSYPASAGTSSTGAR